MSTQQKLTTFLRHFLYSRGKSPNKLLSMTLNELLLEIGLSNELLLKQSEADIKVFSNKLNKHYRNQLKSNLLQKKLMTITPSAGKIYTDLVAEKKHIDSVLDANNINIKISIETFKLNNLENKNSATLTKKIQELHHQMKTRQKIAEENKHTVVENKKIPRPTPDLSDDDIDSNPESTNAIDLSEDDIDSNPELTNAIHSEGGDHGQKVHSDDEGGDHGQKVHSDDDVEGGDHGQKVHSDDDVEGGNSAPEQDEDDVEGGNSAPESDDDDEAQSTPEKKEERIIRNVIGIAICPRGKNHTKFQKSGKTWEAAHGKEKCAGTYIFGGPCGGDEYRCRNGKGADMCCHNHLLACGKWMVEQIKKNEETSEETFGKLYKFCCNGYKKIGGAQKWSREYNVNKPPELQAGWKTKVKKEIEKLKEKINKK